MRSVSSFAIRTISGDVLKTWFSPAMVVSLWSGSEKLLPPPFRNCTSGTCIRYFSTEGEYSSSQAGSQREQTRTSRPKRISWSWSLTSWGFCGAAHCGVRPLLGWTSAGRAAGSDVREPSTIRGVRCYRQTPERMWARQIRRKWGAAGASAGQEAER